MATSDPSQQPPGRVGQPVAGQALPQATPLGSPQPIPQAQPMPQAQPLPAGQAAGARPVAIQSDPSAPRIYQHDKEDEESGEELTSTAMKQSPPWLISAVVHMLLLIILGLLALAMPGKDQVSLNVEMEEEDIWAEKLGEQVELDALGVEDAEVITEPELAFTELPEVDDPFAAPPELELFKTGDMATSDIEARIPGMALKGREEGAKQALGERYGGNKETRDAVALGLLWLARQQREDGSWSLCGPYSDGVADLEFDNPLAATAMALLAFQGNGVTHKKGKFRQNVALGWRWLLKQQGPDGNFFQRGPYRHQFYTQAQCAIAVCELYGMSEDPKYKVPAEKATKYLIDSQGDLGGWKYSPKARSDLSVTGWVVMALQSAKMAGLEVPDEVFERIGGFLDKMATDGGSRYKYESGKPPSVTMTAEGLLCRQYLGWARSDPRLAKGVEYITHPVNLINFDKGRNVYYWYYATQVAHHMEGDYWQRWNEVMRQELPEQQVKKRRAGDRRDESGSWDPLSPTADQWEAFGGRLYVTCLSIYMLEVYYRHLPLYTKVYNELLESDRNKRFEE